MSNVYILEKIYLHIKNAYLPLLSYFIHSLYYYKWVMIQRLHNCGLTLLPKYCNFVMSARFELHQLFCHKGWGRKFYRLNSITIFISEPFIAFIVWICLMVENVQLPIIGYFHIQLTVLDIWLIGNHITSPRLYSNILEALNSRCRLHLLDVHINQMTLSNIVDQNWLHDKNPTVKK